VTQRARLLLIHIKRRRFSVLFVLGLLVACQATPQVKLVDAPDLKTKKAFVTKLLTLASAATLNDPKATGALLDVDFVPVQIDHWSHACPSSDEVGADDHWTIFGHFQTSSQT
jgi:hypothetical protein